MSNLYFYNYNNYYNRIVKKETSLLNYGTPTYSIKSANFYEADGVNSKHTINLQSTDVDYFNANYLIVCDNNDNIISRWFVTETDHNRNRQFILSLRRDLIVDYYDSVINSPVLIEKALLKEDNPLIFNSEGFTFNQIKQSETLLKDVYRQEWLYMYFAKNAPSKNAISLKITQNPYVKYTINTTIDNSIFAEGTKRGRAFDSYFKIWVSRIYYKAYKSPLLPIPTVSGNYKGVFDFDSSSVTFQTRNSTSSDMRLFTEETAPVMGLARKAEHADVWYLPTDTMCDYMKTNYFTASLYNTAVTNLHSDLTSTEMSAADEALLLSLKDECVEDSTGKVYRIRINQSKKSANITNDLTKNFAQALKTGLTSIIDPLNPADNHTFDAYYKYYQYEVTLERQSDLETTINFDIANKQVCNDSECNIVAVPLGPTSFKTSIADPDDPTDYIKITTNDNREHIISICRQIAQEYTSSFCYDIQILPYSPFTEYNWDNEGVIDRYAMDSSEYLYFQNADSGDNIHFFFLQTKDYTFDLNYNLSINSYTDDNALNKKLSNECDIYRLVSPNYNSMFEFSVAKNNGVTKFNVDMTLKPYQPYIHINPDFKELYGDDYNDTRGLILGGDFSLPITGDQFQSYELQNKNYQLIFDRQIAHMDRENKLNRIEAGFGAITGTIQGGTIGAVAGASGGPAGIAAGAGLGGIASAIGGALDYSFLKKRQSENKDLAIDMFNYNLGNIRALPYSLSKINPFSFNYKGFPFVEYYSCTDEEKNILLEKIKYNSMTVMAIGTISDYIQSEQSFIKATLIRFYSQTDAINDHEINEIYNELQKGVYI